MAREPKSGPNPRDKRAPDPRPPTLWQSWMSVLAAFFGVQSSANRERDFTRGKASHFILLGLLATVLLIVVLVGLVKLATSLAGV